MTAEICGLSFAVAPGQACYIPLAHRYAAAPDQLNRERVFAGAQGLVRGSGAPRSARTRSTTSMRS
jgi:DNA polymerase-1